MMFCALNRLMLGSFRLKSILRKTNKNEEQSFLGGTWSQTTWRQRIISLINIDYFDPIVDVWTPECQQNEINEKTHKWNIHLYVITNKMTCVYSIAEAVDSVHNKKVTTIIHVIPDGFVESQIGSLSAVVELVKSRGGVGFIDDDIAITADYINTQFR